MGLLVMQQPQYFLMIGDCMDAKAQINLIYEITNALANTTRLQIIDALKTSAKTPEALAEEALAKLDKYTVEEAKVYVGYYNKEGKLEDTFFDSALFLPYSRFTYSKHYKSADGWKYYIDNLFADGENVDALNEAVGIVGKELGVDFKLKLFFSIFHTAPHYGSFPEKFGDIDGDGLNITDATWLQRYLASVEIPYEIGKIVNKSI